MGPGSNHGKCNIQPRLPRVISAILVGGALSLSGASYQGMFKNRGITGFIRVSAGACVEPLLPY